MQTPTVEAEKRARAAPTPTKPTRRVLPWTLLAIAAAVLLAAAALTLIDGGRTDTEAMLQDYVVDWEGGNFDELPEYFALGGTLVNATAGTTHPPEAISAEMARLAGPGTIDVHHLAVDSSDRIATAIFEIAPPEGDELHGVAVFEIVGGMIRQQTISYVTEFAPRS